MREIFIVLVPEYQISWFKIVHEKGAFSREEYQELSMVMGFNLPDKSLGDGEIDGQTMR